MQLLEIDPEKNVDFTNSTSCQCFVPVDILQSSEGKYTNILLTFKQMFCVTVFFFIQSVKSYGLYNVFKKITYFDCSIFSTKLVFYIPLD